MRRRKCKQPELSRLEELLDRQYGKPGTPKRDAFEKELTNQWDLCGDGKQYWTEHDEKWMRN